MAPRQASAHAVMGVRSWSVDRSLADARRSRPASSERTHLAWETSMPVTSRGSPPLGEENVRMNHGEERAELRGAVYRGDPGSLVGILKREAWPENALQLIGDGLLRVLHAPTEGIDEAARRAVTALWDRGWEGDADLAAGLEAALGSGPLPLLRPLPVELEELAGVLEGDPATGASIYGP